MYFKTIPLPLDRWIGGEGSVEMFFPTYICLLAEEKCFIFLDTIISNFVIFGYNSIHYENKEGCCLS